MSEFPRVTLPGVDLDPDPWRFTEFEPTPFQDAIAKLVDRWVRVELAVWDLHLAQVFVMLPWLTRWLVHSSHEDQVLPQPPSPHRPT